jgi:hypothetical protein
MRKFLVKIFIFFFPAILAIVIYFVTDPFKVLYSYNSYFNRHEKVHIHLNRGYAATETLFRNYNSERQDAYIFGSSRSDNYLIKDWLPHISPTSHCYHFSASAEGLYGIERKMYLLDQRNMPIKTALIALDHWLLGITEDSKGRLFMKHYALSGQNPLLFQYKYFEDYLDPKFVINYVEYLLRGTVTEKMLKEGVMVDVDVAYDHHTNEITYPYLDSLHKAAPDVYYKMRLRAFQSRPRSATEKMSPPVIKEKQMALLQSIKRSLDRNNTDYMFVINPMYDQLRLNTKDLHILYDLFGEENVCDMSGKNRMTEDYHSHFDYYHFDYEIGKQVLDSAYTRRARMRSTVLN